MQILSAHSYQFVQNCPQGVQSQLSYQLFCQLTAINSSVSVSVSSQLICQLICQLTAAINSYTFVRRVCKINSQHLSTPLYGHQLECQQLGEDSYTFVCMVCKINSWRLSTHLSTHSYPLVCQLTAINSSVSSSAISSFANSQFVHICQLMIRICNAICSNQESDSAQHHVEFFQQILEATDSKSHGRMGTNCGCL